MEDIIKAVALFSKDILEYLANIQSILYKGLTLFTETIPSIPL
jgi:hypothetical protein